MKTNDSCDTVDSQDTRTTRNLTVISSSSTNNTTYKTASIELRSKSQLKKKKAENHKVSVRKKFVIVGDGGVGKTCLLKRYSTGKFNDDYVPTVFENSNVIVEANHKIYDLALWDTAGQEEYSRIRHLAYSDVDCFILCFDIHQPDTFSNISSKWFPELNHYAKRVPIVLLGLKADLRETHPAYCTPFERGIQLQIEGLVACYLECSAKSNVLVDRVLETAILMSEENEQKNRKRNCKMM